MKATNRTTKDKNMTETYTPHIDGPIAVHIIDDDLAIRDSLIWLFYSRGIAVKAWDGGDEFLKAWSPTMTGCFLLDIRMHPTSGLEVFNQLLERGAPQPVIFLTGHGDLPMAVDALKRGAVDFIEKPFNDNDLVDRVIKVLQQAQKNQQQRMRLHERDERASTLSAREKEVLESILQGLLNKQIADILGVSMRTIEVHRARILEKMGVKNAIELARLFSIDSEPMDK